MQLYRFQVYNSLIHHLYVVLCVRHPIVWCLTVDAQREISGGSHPSQAEGSIP